MGEELDVPQHVLRFWETRFSQIRPMKRGGGRRYYRVNDVDLLKGIRQLLYGKGYTIKGVQRILKERGVAHVTDIGRGNDPRADAPAVTKKPASAQKTAKNKTAAAQDENAGLALTSLKKEELELALADLAAAKRLLTSEKKT